MKHLMHAGFLALVWIAAVLGTAAPVVGNGPCPSVSWESGSQGHLSAEVGRIPSNLRFDRISVSEGLPHSTVNCILQDHYGFMWFGTDDGLSRYDGYDFVVYRHRPQDSGSLSHNRIWSLFEDSSGTLWVGTYGGGLNRFNRASGTFTRYGAQDFRNVTDEPEEFRNVIRAIDEGPNGVLWIATYGGGLVKLDVGREVFTSYAPDPLDSRYWGHEWITAMLVDRTGQIWIGTHSEGLDRFDPGSGQITSYRHDPESPNGLGHNWITDLLQDHTGQIWIATYGGGLNRFDPETEGFTYFRHDPSDSQSLADDFLWSIAKDASGALWVGSYGGGLDRFDAETGRFIHYRHDPTDLQSLSSDRIRVVYRSRSDLLWVGTHGGGVNRSDPASSRFSHYRRVVDPLAALDGSDVAVDCPVLALEEDEAGLLWIGTSGGGLDRLDRRTGTWYHDRHDPADPLSLASHVVYAIHKSGSGILWIGTGDGIYRLGGTNGGFERLDHRPPDPGAVKRETIYAITEDRSGVLWLATHGRGLSAYDPATGSFSYYQHGWDARTGFPTLHTLSSNFVRDVVEDDSGRLWIATQDGLNAYDPATGRWVWFQHDPDDPQTLSHDWVMALHLAPSGYLWIGTQGGGVNRLNPDNGEFVAYRERDGLANDMVADILSDQDGMLWFATANGLSRFDPSGETFTNYGVSDGLPFSEFNVALQGSGGELLFGGVRGLISFYPEEIAPNPYVPPIVLTFLEQNGVVIEQRGQALEDLSAATLRWPDNSLEFGFAALNYTQPDKNQHAYKLEGFDRTWNHIGARRFGRYTNLPGGSYTLRLIGSNNDGVWNEHGRSLIGSFSVLHGGRSSTGRSVWDSSESLASLRLPSGCFGSSGGAGEAHWLWRVGYLPSWG